MLHRVIKQIWQNWNDSQTSHGGSPCPDARILGVLEGLLRLSNGCVYCECGKSPVIKQPLGFTSFLAFEVNTHGCNGLEGGPLDGRDSDTSGFGEIRSLNRGRTTVMRFV